MKIRCQKALSRRARIGQHFNNDMVERVSATQMSTFLHFGKGLLLSPQSHLSPWGDMPLVFQVWKTGRWDRLCCLWQINKNRSKLLLSLTKRHWEVVEYSGFSFSFQSPIYPDFLLLKFKLKPADTKALAFHSEGHKSFPLNQPKVNEEHTWTWGQIHWVANCDPTCKLTR